MSSASNTQHPRRNAASNAAEVVNSTLKRGDCWVTDRAWVSGLAGFITLLILAIVYAKFGWLNQGVEIQGWRITSTKIDSALLALLVSSTVMVVVELVRLWLWGSAFRFQLHPAIKQRRWLDFIVECGLNYAAYLLLLWCIQLFYFSASEYGYVRRDAYYQPWFRFLEILVPLWLYAGLPYVLLTRALKHNAEADSRDYGLFILRLLAWPLQKLLGLPTQCDSRREKKILLGLLVKIFFTPLMTVFFVDVFGHLVNNVHYLSHGWIHALSQAHYQLDDFNRDLFNVSHSLIFTIDVGLAWCGYVVSSRWVDNQTLSAEPTTLGWVVCLLCYPPFQMTGLLYGTPDDKAILNFGHDVIALVFTIAMLSSYLIYMWATLCFGVRFSNLTNRGIIRTGPFAWVRHPAYAAKNLAWWLIMLPVVLMTLPHNPTLALGQLMGMGLMTALYYFRANTEERHLSSDPTYLQYCEQVRYRFIPKLW